MSNYSIYVIENKINGKIYVGKTINPKNRWKTHKSVSSGGKCKYKNKYFALHAALSKYGLNNFSFDVIMHCYDNNEANEFEKYWISYLKWFGIKLYNETDGGDGASPWTKFTESHKRNIALARIGYKATISAKLNMSAARKLEFAGEKNNKAKLSESKIKEIRQLYASGNFSHSQLGKIFGVTKATIGKIINHKLWTHLK